MNLILNNYDKIKLTILILLVASLPFHIFASSILIILGTVLTLLKFLAKRRLEIVGGNSLSVALICYFVLEVVGLLYTDRENMSEGLFTLEKHQAFIFIPFIFLDFKVSAKQREQLFTAFVASCLVGCLICVVANVYYSLTEFDTLIQEWRFSHSRLAEPIDMHPVYFAMYLSMAVLMILFEMKEKATSFSRAKLNGLFLLAGFFIVMIVFLGARTIITALMIIIMINLVKYGLDKKSYVPLLISLGIPLIFVALILANPIVNTRFRDLMKDNIKDSNYGGYFARSQIWEPGIEAISENLWFGVGTGDHDTELNKKFEKYGFTDGLKVNSNMHNQYLQSTLNLGIVGVTALLLIFVVQFKWAIRGKDWLYLSFILLFMCGCLTESMLSSNKGIIFFLVFSFIFYRSELGMNSPTLREG